MSAAWDDPVGKLRAAEAEVSRLRARLAELESDAEQPNVYGLCTGCGTVEVSLVSVTGTRDLSSIGESAAYPTGYGCEVCS